MSYNLCAISGNIPINPTFCVKTGLIYERELIEDYITAEGKCPITLTSITKEDLFPIDNTIYNKPREIDETGVSGLLNKISGEMNLLMGEIGELKRKINDTRKELTYESYKYDASINVINNLIQEKEIALMQIEKYKEIVQSNMQNE